ncbi:hypothetical protein SAMN05216251_108111 [Actinacidiphila alni]|uniref:DUF3592 domain-containing protein n=1 Tax=Actinacidiphila alni TaxID=380248 RepID=A0A1I2FXI7_9ACTN|nr:hypothetical protein [Actinacidiphila alni]SFF09528.1 hypothetical protein SAMN05216251_108111 [Actinacidiphila alni]
MVKRSRSRRMAEGTWGLVLLSRVVGAWALILLLLASGAWDSWKTAQYLVLTKGHERGTMTLAHCADSTCTGPFSPKGSAVARPEVRISLPVRHHVGDRVPVVVEPDSDTVVRSGWGGFFFSWVPLAGALLLAGIVAGGALRMRRTGWTLAGLGAALVGAAFLLL